MTTVLFWDIDGTLLNTGGASSMALTHAYRDVIGLDVDLSQIQMAGSIDSIITADILRSHNITPTPDKMQHVIKRYGEYLPDTLPRCPGSILPGVQAILDDLHPRHNVFSLLLTGNTQIGAETKLSYYGLDNYFRASSSAPLNGGFADGMPTRVAVAQQALSQAHQLTGTEELKTFVIGDTPYDIHCGKAIGAKVIAIASGSYSQTELEQHEPWWTFTSFPDPSQFWQQLEAAPLSTATMGNG